MAPEQAGPKIVGDPVVPGPPDDGEIAVIAGTTTLKPLKGADVAESVVTVTVRKPGAAPGAIVTVADKVVGCTEAIAAVTPVPLNVMAVEPFKF